MVRFELNLSCCTTVKRIQVQLALQARKTTVAPGGEKSTIEKL